MKLLLVEPDFPVPPKSKNHKNFLPIGLLKIGGYYKDKKNIKRIELVCGNKEIDFIPERIYITSLFTYWSDCFWNSVSFYRERFPKAFIQVGGIYVSLFYDNLNFKDKCKKFKVNPHRGVLKYAEKKNKPNYSLLPTNPHPIDYQIIHTSRGCIRNCKFCGTWKIEPNIEAKSSIKGEIKYRKIVFYDNNLLANPYIENILAELIELKKNKNIMWCESQSGFDGRILIEKPYLSDMIRKAGFREPRIAWDWGYEKYNEVDKQIQILEDAGFHRKDIYIFMIYNWNLDFEEMEKKRIKCYEWKVQISDCRNRPLTQLHDHYKPLKDQSDGNEYHINQNWTDAEVKQFRKNVRRQNIIVRQGLRYHSKLLENKENFTREQFRVLKAMPIEEARKYLPDLWIPSEITPPKNREKWIVEKEKLNPVPIIFDTISTSTLHKISPIIQMH